MKTGLLCGVMLVLSVGSSLADTKVSSVGGWDIEAVEASGRATSCRATRREGELRFSFVEGESGSGVNLSTERWKLDRGTTYKLSLAAPPDASASGLARATAGNELDMPVSAEFLQHLDGKTALEVRPVALSYRVSLARAPEALKALKDCWAARSPKSAAPSPAQAAAPSNPQQPASAPPVKPVVLPSSLSLDKVTSFARAVFGADAEIQSAGPENFNIVSGIIVTNISTANAPGQIDTALVAISGSLAGNCKGPSSPEITAVESLGPVKLGHFQFGCDTGGDRPTQFDATVVSDGRRVEVYSVLSPDRDAATKAGARIYNALRQSYY